MLHSSPLIDRWRPMSGIVRDEDTIDVWVSGMRYDDGTAGEDMITASNVAPGFLSEVSLPVADARRLSEALLLACELAGARDVLEVRRPAGLTDERWACIVVAMDKFFATSVAAARGGMADPDI